MKLVIDKFKIITDKKITQPVKIVACSDLHAGESFLNSGQMNLKSTIRGIKEILGVDLIVVVGDLVNNPHSLKTARVMSNLRRFLEEAGKIAPVLIVNGNHDLYLESKKTKELYQSLGEIPNVEILDNKQKRIGKNLVVTGFSPAHSAYGLIKHGRISRKVAIKDFKKAKFKFSEEDFNVILTHSPYSLANKVVLKKMPKVFRDGDVMLSGHLHNGMLFSGNVEWMRKYFNKAGDKSLVRRIFGKSLDKGIWLVPKTVFLIGLCRGARLVGRGEIGRTILPSSKEYVEILAEDKEKMVQMTMKGINKYSVASGVMAKPSIIELIIEGK